MARRRRRRSSSAPTWTHLDDSGALPDRRRQRRADGGHALQRPLPHAAPRRGPAPRCGRTPAGKAAYRGPWMMETTAREEMMDVAARADRASTRSSSGARNVIQRSDLPYMSPGGMLHRERLAGRDPRPGRRDHRLRRSSAPSRPRPPRRVATSASGSRLYVEPQPAIMVYENDRRTCACTPTAGSTCSSVPARTVRASRPPPRSSSAEYLGVDYRRRHRAPGRHRERARSAPGTGGSRSGPMIGAAVQEASLMLQGEGGRHRRPPARSRARGPRGRRTASCR